MEHRKYKVLVLALGLVIVAVLFVALFSSHNGRYVMYPNGSDTMVFDTSAGVMYLYIKATDEVLAANLQTGRFVSQKVKRLNK
jgi:hypothetical protein